MSKSKINNLIIGHKGQDGSLLRSQLNQEGLSWLGIDLGSVDSNYSSLTSSLGLIDICNPEHVQEIFRKTIPDNIYYLAAHHRSSSMGAQSSASYFRSGLAVNVQGPLNFLEAIATHSPKSRFLYISSSLIYAPTDSPAQTISESSRMAPMESYAWEKIIAGHYCKEFRTRYNVYASVAIPFNHESEYRPQGFFTRDATDAIAEIRLGKRKCWEVGTLDAIVDWSYAGDAISAFRNILELETPDDFIISSGIGHTTGDFIKIACDYAGIDFNKSIVVDPKKVDRLNNCRIGDSSKLRNATGWRPTIDFPDLVKRLMQAAIERSVSAKLS